MDAGDADMKKRRNDDYYDHYTSKNKVNGEQNGSENRPRERDSRERSKHDGSFKVKDNRKEAMPGPDDSPKLKSKEKKEKSSSKKQKK